MYGLYVLFSVCMYGYFEDDCIIHFTSASEFWNLNVFFNSIKTMKTGCYKSNIVS